jgi:hypothetical protein
MAFYESDIDVCCPDESAQINEGRTKKNNILYAANSVFSNSMLKQMLSTSLNLAGIDLYEQLKKIVSSILLYKKCCIGRIGKETISIQTISNHFKQLHIDGGKEYKDRLQKETKRYDLTLYRKTPIIAVYTEFERSTFVDLLTINTEKHIKNLHRFIKKLEREDAKSLALNHSVSCWIVNGNYTRRVNNVIDRDLDTVFIDKQTKYDILSDIDNFVANKQWYKDHRISYHYGIILHGEPGTGKSSLIRAIISHYKYNAIICTDNFARFIDNIDDMLDNNFMRNLPDDEPFFIIVEDIDIQTAKLRDRTMRTIGADEAKNADDEYQREKISLLLNKMDGLLGIENVIYIFTTNHIDKIDEALNRPGRIDKAYKISYVETPAFIEFLKYHFGNDIKIPASKRVKPHLTFAELQLEILGKKSLDYMIETYME